MNIKRKKKRFKHHLLWAKAVFVATYTDYDAENNDPHSGYHQHPKSLPQNVRFLGGEFAGFFRNNLLTLIFFWR